MPNPREIFSSISNAVGVEDVEGEEGSALSVSSYEQKEVARAEDFTGKGELNDQQLSDDYAFARKNVQDAIESGQSALQAAVEVASATGNPEIFASVSSLLHSLIHANKALLDIQSQVKKTKVVDQKLAGPAKGDPGSEDGPRIFFEGTVDDMLMALEKVEEKRKKNLAIEGEFEVVG